MNVEELISLLENEDGKSEVVLAYKNDNERHKFSLIEDIGIDLQCSIGEPVAVFDDPIELEEQEHQNCVVLWPY